MLDLILLESLNLIETLFMGMGGGTGYYRPEALESVKQGKEDTTLWFLILGGLPLTVFLYWKFRVKRQ